MEKITKLIEEIRAKDIADFLIAIAILIVFFIISSWLPKVIMKMLKIKENDKKRLKQNDVYKGLKYIFLCIGVYLAIIILDLPESALSLCIRILRIVVILSMAKIMVGLISPESMIMRKVKENNKYEQNKSAIKVGVKVVKVIIYTIAVFMIIADLGYDLNGVITGLGLGSVVIALAAQELVSNLLSGMAIASEKPFKIGDWVTIGDISGTVIDIKFRSIKVRTVDKTTVTILNTKVLDEAIINYDSIDVRKLDMTLRLPLDIKSNKLDELIKSIKNLLNSVQEIDPKTIQVYIDGINSDCIAVYLFMYVNISDLVEFNQFKTKINLMIIRLLDDKDIKLVPPVSKVQMENEDTNNC